MDRVICSAARLPHVVSTDCQATQQRKLEPKSASTGTHTFATISGLEMPPIRLVELSFPIRRHMSVALL